MKNKSKITNTVEEIGTDIGRMTALMVGMGGSSSLADHYEKRGQSELVNSRELPTKMGAHDSSDYVKVYKKMGIKVLREKPNDPMFCETVMPEGWKVKRTDHSMWSDLLDDKGRKRASIFYKADFWDRDAFISLNCRFTIDFHKYLPEEEKYLPPVTTMVEEEIEGREIERRTNNGYGKSGYMCYDEEDERGNIVRWNREPPKRTRMVPVTTTPRRYANLYEETMVTPYWVEVKDCDGTVLFSTEKQYFTTPYPVLHKEGQHELWTEEEKEAHYTWWKQKEEFENLQLGLGKLWLKQHYPKYADPHAYWDAGITSKSKIVKKKK